jgi:diguanylate cyclase (GGDEF)-like protein/PAS domain S-box-containing protein
MTSNLLLTHVNKDLPMPAAPLRPDEADSLAALRALDVLDTPAEAQFQALVQAASAVCGVPISLISLIDSDRQWFKANVGLPGVSETPRDAAFCAHVVLGEGVMEVPDATQDPRFADNPLVTGQPDIRFYAGAPVRLHSGEAVGTLCVIDRQPRRLNDMQRTVLQQLAVAAAHALEGRRALAQLRQATAEAAEAALVLRHSADAVIALGPDGHILRCNAAVQQLFGHAPGVLVGQPVTVLLPAPAADLATLMRQHTASGHELSYEDTWLHRNGRRIDVSVTPVSQFDEAGRLTGVTKFVRDITARKAAERALQDERDRLNNLIEGTNAGTWEWHIPSGRVRLNERSAAIIGFGIDELDQSIATREQMTHPDDMAVSVARAKAHFRGQADHYESETRMRHKQGHWVWVLARGRVMRWAADGRPETMYGIHQDITQRKQAEEVLRKARSFLDRTGRQAGIGGWELDLVDQQVVWSDETCRLHGLPPGHQPTLDEAIGYYVADDQPVLQQAVADALAGGPGFDRELRLTRADGRTIWVRVVGAVEFRGGQPFRLTGALQDITERVQERQALREANARMALAADSGRIGIWDWDIVADELHWDDWVYRLHGLVPDGTPANYSLWASQVHPDDLAPTEQALQAAIAGGTAFDAEFRVRWPDGSVRHMRSSGRATCDAQGRALRMVGANWDVTESRRLTAELAAQHELLRVTLKSIGDAVITTDAQGRIDWMNPVAERMTGWPTADARGRPLSQVFHIVNEETRAVTENPVATCLAQGKIAGLANHTVLISRDGIEYGIEDSAAPIRNDSGAVLGAVLVFHDVSEQRRLSGEMTWRATHDTLTGLVNRAEFESRLLHLLRRAHDDAGEHALLYIDLDQFKLVNDACGHAVGDQLLQQVSKLLAESVRARDTLARLGGDEFGVLLENCTCEQAQRVAQKICDRMDDFRFVHDERRFRIGTSIGLVPVDRRWSSTAAIQQAADTSCYAAKEAGRNRVHVWFDSDQAMRARKFEMQWTSRIEHALDDDGFVLFGQRILTLSDSATQSPGLHAEVLLRMTNDDGSLTLPGAFLPAAERFHLVSRVDRWVLRRVLAWMAALPPLAEVALLSVNLSGQSVGDRSFHAWAIEQLDNAGPAVCAKLCLEITETAAVTNLADAALFIERVRATGVRVALDDFGAGASSFGYLKTLPVDLLKIDGQFIRDLVTDPLDDAAVRCFADVARVVGVQTVAEFVDQPAVLQRLREIGIDYAQGFLVHRPEPLEALVAAALPRLVGA